MTPDKPLFMVSVNLLTANERITRARESLNKDMEWTAMGLIRLVIQDLAEAQETIAKEYVRKTCPPKIE